MPKSSLNPIAAHIVVLCLAFGIGFAISYLIGAGAVAGAQKKTFADVIHTAYNKQPSAFKIGVPMGALAIGLLLWGILLVTGLFVRVSTALLLMGAVFLS